MRKTYGIYIMTNKYHGTLYTGITNNLLRRVYEHKNNYVDGFTKKYKLHSLVYYELFEKPEYAIQREKQLKKWKRAWKISLIEKDNPKWIDLYNKLA
jgi:putative endonuclease